MASDPVPPSGGPGSGEALILWRGNLPAGRGVAAERIAHVVPAAVAPQAIPAPDIPPRTNEAALPPWRANAVRVSLPQGRPLIAIVIDDLGMDRRRSAEAAALPGPLTLAWLPYAGNLEQQTAAAREHGHELLVHMPMEPLGGEYPGPNALTTSLSADTVRHRLGQHLDRFPGHVGMNNHMGSRFTSNARAMAPVIDELRARGLMFLDSRTAGSSVAASMALEAGLPTAARDVFLDNGPFSSEVQSRLREVEEIARRRGHAVAIGHPYDVTLSTLRWWLPDVQRRGFALAPISAIARQRPGTQIAQQPPRPVDHEQFGGLH